MNMDRSKTREPIATFVRDSVVLIVTVSMTAGCDKYNDPSDRPIAVSSIQSEGSQATATILDALRRCPPWTTVRTNDQPKVDELIHCVAVLSTYETTELRVAIQRFINEVSVR